MCCATSDSGYPAWVAADRARRRRLAELPIEEKLRIMVRLQHLAAQIAQANGRPVRKPWTTNL